MLSLTKSLSRKGIYLPHAVQMFQDNASTDEKKYIRGAKSLIHRRINKGSCIQESSGVGKQRMQIIKHRIIREKRFCLKRLCSDLALSSKEGSKTQTHRHKPDSTWPLEPVFGEIGSTRLPQIGALPKSRGMALT